MSDPQRQKFNAEEASWLRYRMSCGADTQCITNAYKGRIDVLENIRHVAALTKGRNPTPAGTPTTAAPYDTFSGVLISGQGDLVLNFKENGEFVEGAVFLPRVERHRILRACKLNQPCTVIGITGPPTPKCGPDCANVVKIISVFAGNIRE